jgi:hypothetical protein
VRCRSHRTIADGVGGGVVAVVVRINGQNGGDREKLREACCPLERLVDTAIFIFLSDVCASLRSDAVINAFGVGSLLRRSCHSMSFLVTVGSSNLDKRRLKPCWKGRRRVACALHKAS